MFTPTNRLWKKPAVFAWLALALAAPHAACGVGPDSAPEADASDPRDGGTDEGQPESGAVVDGALPDAGVDGSALDSGTRCGDKLRAGAEACDGDQKPCSDLAGVYSGGNAVCRADCSGYDTSACAVAPAGKRALEWVYPRQRDAAKWGSARCNESGDYNFTVSLPSVRSKVWQINLEGGGYCDGKVIPCATRPGSLIAAVDGAGAPLPADRTTDRTGNVGGGDFGAANLVQGNYCSSDLWGGTNDTPQPITGPNGTRPWVFTGRLNVRAMIQVLVERYGLDDKDPATRVLFMGSSAGGWGVHQTADVVAGALPTVAQRRALLLAPKAGFVPFTFNQSGYAFGIPAGYTYDSGPKYASEVFKSGILPQCAIEHVGSEHRCLSSPVLVEYLTAARPRGLDLPVLEYQNEQDATYMDLVKIPNVAATNTAADTAARAAWVRANDEAMGLPAGACVASTQATSSRLRWLYAVSDPVDTTRGETRSNNVHGLGAYTTDSPFGAGYGYSDVLHRFWTGSTGEVVRACGNFP